VITAVDAVAVRDPAQLVQLVERHGVGRAMTLTVQRQQRTLRVSLTPVELSTLIPSE